MQSCGYINQSECKVTWPPRQQAAGSRQAQQHICTHMHTLVKVHEDTLCARIMAVKQQCQHASISPPHTHTHTRNLQPPNCISTRTFTCVCLCVSAHLKAYTKLLIQQKANTSCHFDAELARQLCYCFCLCFCFCFSCIILAGLALTLRAAVAVDMATSVGVDFIVLVTLSWYALRCCCCGSHCCCSHLWCVS